MVEFVTNWLDKNDVGERIALMPVYGDPAGAWEKRAMRTKRGFCLINHLVVEDVTYYEHLLYFDTKRIRHIDILEWLIALGYKIEGSSISLPTERQV